MSPTPPYIEFHARTAYSFLRGASQPEHLAEAAADNGVGGLAVLDRDGVYGSPSFHAAAGERGVRPIVGAELTMNDGCALPVVVVTRTGYRNLCRLITRSQLRSPKGEGSIAWQELPEFADGLVALTGDLDEGPLGIGWRRGGKAGLWAALRRIRKAFPGEGAVQVEIQRHHRREETPFNRLLVDLAAAEDLPLLATNGVAYAWPGGRQVQDLFTCLREHTHLDQAGRLLAQNAERHVKSPQAMARLFADLPEALENGRRLADRIAFSMENLGYAFPDFPVDPGETMEGVLREETCRGARRRYGKITGPIRRQLEHELALIEKLGFCGYFLVVWDIVNFCRDSGIMVQGRGSAANSAVCYSLGITAADPIGGKLLFERFLSEGRKSWPDIDLDLPSGERRERVIQEVYRRYTRFGAAMTANTITYRGRSAVREIGKVLHFPEELLNRFSDLYANGDYPHTLKLRDQLAQAGISEKHPRATAMTTLYAQIYGLPRHLGQHSGGMVLTRGRLDAVVPLENASMKDRTVVQWNKDDCEDMGLVKVDLLGLGMMAVLEDAVKLTAERGHPVDFATIPKDDPATYELMCAADTVGVFQIESRAQMATLPRMQPRCFYDLVVEVAIIRPGPIVGQLAHPYLERRAGRQPISYIDDQLVPVLERTLGVPLFQEQVLKMAMVMADFSGSEAEELRRAMSFHRNQERMNRVKRKLEAALDQRGVEPEKRDQIVSAIGSFALYGFPESHAISFALLAYASAYLKVHYPAEFYAGLLNNQPMGFYSPATIIQEARRRGMRFLPPCVLQSAWPCTIIDDATIRLGLNHVRGVSGKAADGLLDSRTRGGFFHSVRDLRRRTRLARDELQALAAAGALNALAGDRRTALWQVSEKIEEDLFSWAIEGTGMVEPGGETTARSPLPRMTLTERLRADFAVTGVTTGRHPMAHYRERISPEITPAEELPRKRHGEWVRVAGAVICRQRPGTAKGVVFVSLEDETGITNSILYADFFEKHRLIITREPYLVLSGPLQHRHGVIHVQAKKAERLALEDLPAATSHDFH